MLKEAESEAAESAAGKLWRGIGYTSTIYFSRTQRQEDKNDGAGTCQPFSLRCVKELTRNVFFFKTTDDRVRGNCGDHGSPITCRQEWVIAFPVADPAG